VLRAATIATMPRWMRDLANLRQPSLVDRGLVPLMRAIFRGVAASTRLELALLGWITPSTRPVVEPAFRGISPQRKETLTPAEARERYDALTPLELYRRIRDSASTENADLEPVAQGTG
jgi:hypothetical protein